MGPVEEKLIKQMLKDGVPLPDHLANAPTLLAGLVFFYNAHQDLSSDRSIGMSLGPIPWTAINQYCREYKIKGQQREDMFYHVEALDEVYRAHVEKKKK